MRLVSSGGLLVLMILAGLLWSGRHGEISTESGPAGFTGNTALSEERSEAAGAHGSTSESENDSLSGEEDADRSGPPSVNDLKNLKERFSYEVRYGRFRLGDIDVYLKQDTLVDGTEAIHMVTEMVSNHSAWLIGYRELHFHTLMAYNDTIPYSLKFWHDNIHDEKPERYVFDFDYENGVALSYEEGELIDTLELDRPADGGPVTMYYSRLFAGTDAEKSYPVYIDHGRSDMEMVFSSEKEPYESEAFPGEEFYVYQVEGVADFDGPFGFSGEFTGYYRDDKYRIPLEARASVWIGSVRVRLVDYERIE